MALSEVGLIQALTETIGEADAEIGGFRMTRTTAVITDGVDLAGDYQWPGGSAATQVVLTNDTTGVAVGDFIGFRTDDQLWEVSARVIGVSVTLLNPLGLTFPTDAGPAFGTTFEAVRTFLVETTNEWPSVGTIALDGVVYSYAGKTSTSFTGITHEAGGATVAGSAMAHRDETTVTDISKQWSALDLLRRATLVNYAEGADLDAVGRNLGVDHVRLFTSDAQYRAVIKALAYNPRGTMFGLELALDALVGTGNYEIYEDLINFPNVVFILLTAGYTGAASAGSTYLTGPEWDDVAGAPVTDLVLSATPLAIEGVVLYAMDELFDFRNAKPSAVTYDYYPGVGAPAIAFRYLGAEAEGTATTQVPGLYTKFQNTAGAGDTVFYQMDGGIGARITEASFVEVNLLMYVPAAANRKAGEYDQASIKIYDGNYRISFGVDTVNAGLYKTMVGGFLGTTFVFADDTWYDVTVRKYDNRYVELLVNGQFITRVDYESFNQATANHQIEFGIQGAPNVGMSMYAKQIGIAHRTSTDYWNSRGLVGTVAAANPARFDANTGGNIFIAGDVGKRVQLSNSAITKVPSGGNNNGIWKIDSLVGGPPSDIVELVGDDKTGADILDFTNYPKRITISDDDEAFTFPDDLGQSIVLSGSTLGNNLTRTIEKLLEPGSLSDLAADFDTGDQVTLKTNVCEVSVNLAATESNLDYHLVPTFENEAAALDWELSDSGSFAGTAVTLRQAMWALSLIMEIRISNVLTGQIQETSVVTNVASAPPPPHTYEIYPFYLSDPFGLVRAYIDAITAAGVKPEYGISS